MIYDELTREEKLEQVINWVIISLEQWLQWCQRQAFVSFNEIQRVESMLTLVTNRKKKLSRDPLASWRRIGA